MSKIVKVFFTLSVLLNVALGGVALGHVYRMINESPWADIRGDVSPETRQIMRQAYKDKHKEIWALREEMREKKDALRDLIVADSFDVKAFETAADEMKAQNEKAFDSRVDTFSKVLSSLSKPERKKLAQRTVDILAGQRKWDKSKGKHGEDARDENKNPFSSDEGKHEGKPHHGKKDPKD